MLTRRRRLALAVVAAAAACLALAHRSASPALAEPTSWSLAEVSQRRRRPASAASSCQSTRVGQRLSADSSGRVCDITAVAAGGCCGGTGSAYDCSGCVDGCCDEFEYCVSCCLAPGQAPVRDALRARGAIDVFSAASTSDFDVCSYRCRSSSASLFHMNAYRSARHHCYGEVAVPPLGPPSLETLPNSDGALAPGSVSRPDPPPRPAAPAAAAAASTSRLPCRTENCAAPLVGDGHGGPAGGSQSG